MRRIEFVVVFALFIIHHTLSTVVYGGVGGASANFLQENLSARQVGMGGLFVATTDDSNSISTNPAGLMRLRNPEINFSYAHTQDTSFHSFVGYAHPLLTRFPIRMAIGAGISYYSAGNIDVNYANGTTQSFNAERGYAASFSLGAGILEWLHVGISPKVIRSTLVEQFTASGFAVDAGAMFFPLPSILKQRIAFGAAAQNLGPTISYKAANYDLPRIYSLGGAARFFDHPDYGSLLFSVQMEKLLDENWRYRVGGEYGLSINGEDRSFFLRYGYRVNFDSENYSMGIGFREKNLEMDYAFVNAAELEKTHRFTVKFRFGKGNKTEKPEEDLIKNANQPEEFKIIAPKDIQKDEGTLYKPKKSDDQYLMQEQIKTDKQDEYNLIEQQNKKKEKKME